MTTIYCLEGSLQRGPNTGECVFFFKILLFFIYLVFITYVLNAPKIIKLCMKKKI